MATKLWLNSSNQWVTSSTTYHSSTTGTNSSYCRTSVSTSVYVEDDGAIKVSLSYASWSNTQHAFSGYASENAIKITSGSTTIATGSFSGSSGTRTYNITGYSSITVYWAAHPYNGAGQYGPQGSATINISFSSPTFTLSYDANGGSDAPASLTLFINTEGTVASSTPSRTGYTFSKWNTLSDGTGTDYASNASITISADTVLYALWTKNDYTVSISADEGSIITFDSNTYNNITTTVSKPYNKSCNLTIVASSGWVIETRSHNDGTITIPANNDTFIYATSKRLAGCRIDNGLEWNQYLIYIDNGTSWDMYVCYIDNGTSWDMLC